MSQSKPGFVPYFGYEDAKTAMAFLETAFGFKTSQAFEDDTGQIMHAEMTFAGGAIMLGTGRDEQRPEGSADQPAGRGVYCVVEDVDAHFQRAKDAGARIVYPPEDTPFGTRRYRVLDPEGYEWSFGSYAPQID